MGGHSPCTARVAARKKQELEGPGEVGSVPVSPRTPLAYGARVCGKRWISDLVSGRGAGPKDAHAGAEASRRWIRAPAPRRRRRDGPRPARAALPERSAPRVSAATRGAGPGRGRRESAAGCARCRSCRPAAEPRFVPGRGAERGVHGRLPDPPGPFPRVSEHACAPLPARARWVLGVWGFFFFSFFFPPAFPPPRPPCSRFYFWLPVRVLLLPSEILY